MIFKYYKFILYSFFLFTISCAGSRHNQQKSIDNSFDIFLLIGQSNMAGFGKVEIVDTVSLKNVYLFNDNNQWDIAKNTNNEGFNRYSNVKSITNKLSPSYSFALKIAAYTNKRIGIISNARGATTLDQWQKGYSGNNDFNLYEETLIRTKAALTSKPGAKIKAIIWHQGEGDSSKDKSAVYLDKLNKLVTDLRTDLNDREITIIAGEIGAWGDRGTYINPQIRQINKHIPNAGWVSSNGLTSLNEAKNDPHFDTPSVRALGGRYADKAAELIYNLKPTGVTLYSLSNYQGRSVLLTAGSYTSEDLERNGIRITEILSATIDKGHKLVLKTKNGDETLIRNASNINSKVTSLVVH